MLSGGRPKDFAFPLLIAAVVSVLLVYCTGLLIGIMQYQSRISSAQNGLTIGQVIFYLDIENKIYSTIQDLTNDTKDLSDINTCYQQASEEVTYRISRVCSLLLNRNSAEVANNFAICDAFLRKIPLDAKVAQQSTSTTKFNSQSPSIQSASNKNDQSSVTAAPIIVSKDVCGTSNMSQISLSDVELQTIEKAFSRIFDEEDKDKTPIGEVINLYRDDLSRIASLNQTISIDLQPRVDFQRQQYTSSCDYLRELTQILAYRPTDYSFCKDSNFALQSLNGIPQGVIPQGSMEQTQPSSPPADLSNSSSADRNVASKLTPVVPQAGKSSGNFASTKSNADPNVPDTATTVPSAAHSGGSATTNGGLQAPAAVDAGQSPLAKSFPRVASPSVVLTVTAPPFGTLTFPRQNEGNPTAAQQSLPASAQRDFELVSHYRFYQGLTFNQLSGLIISPPEFLAFFLVCISGILGALLRIVLLSYTSGQNPTSRTILIGPLLGLICALVVYILFRSGYIAITDRSQNGDGSVLSPFIIAFASLASGMLSKQAVERFRDLSFTWFGNHDTEEPDRWASQLKSFVKSAEEIGNLARRINVSPGLLADWLNEKSPVPADKQHDISMVLDVPLRLIFTNIPPSNETSA